MTATAEAPVSEDLFEREAPRLTSVSATGVRPGPGRVVHGVTRDGLEVVRDRSSHYYVADPKTRRRQRVGIERAAQILSEDGSSWIAGAEGGDALDMAVMRYLGFGESAADEPKSEQLAFLPGPANAEQVVQEPEEAESRSEQELADPEDAHEPEQEVSPSEDAASEAPSAEPQDCAVYGAASGSVSQVDLTVDVPEVAGQKQDEARLQVAGAPSVSVEVEGRTVTINLSISLQLI